MLDFRIPKLPASNAVRHARSLLALGAAIGMLAASSVPSTAITFKSWEVASEFNDTSNPAGVWSYGGEATLNSAFNLLTNTYNSPPIVGWLATPTDPPAVDHNTTNVPQGPFGNVFVVYPPHAMSMHPGPNCEYAVTRFTAPKKGKYRVSGQFYAMNYNAGTTTDVHVSVNQVAVYGSQIDYNAGLTSASFTPLNLSLAAGDTVDFQVGCGNGNYFSDTTGLNAVIEKK